MQHFWEFTRLYMVHRGIDPKGTRLLRRLTDALVLRDTCAPRVARSSFPAEVRDPVLASTARQDRVSDGSPSSVAMQSTTEAP